MKLTMAAALVAASCMSSGALAGERVGDAALGALSGAVVFGPIGALAGAAVGYTTGPEIAHSWGLRRTDPRYSRRPVKRAAAKPAPQGTPSKPAASTTGTGVRNDPAPRPTAAPARPVSTGSTAGSTSRMVPVQAFD
jgi:hypothetical protein